MRRTALLIVLVCTLFLPLPVFAAEAPHNSGVRHNASLRVDTGTHSFVPAAPAQPLAQGDVGIIQTSLAGANVRSGPGKGYAIVGSVANGSRVVVIDSVHGQAVLPGNDLWYLIGQNRYLYSDVVRLTGEKADPENAPAPPPAQPAPSNPPPAAPGNAAPMPDQKTGVVETSAVGVNLRVAPTTRSAIAGTLAAGAGIEVKAAVHGEEVSAGNNVWYDLGGKYIYSGLVRLGVAPQPSPSTPNVPQGWTLISQNTTSFAYSDWGRIINIRVSTAKLDGMTIPAGAQFSLNNALGPVVVSAGYQMSEGLIGATVVPSLGGGICQTATTLYRAAFFAGLPINQRVNHSLRLSWYEDKPGMDATISDGWPDLIFTNDTGAPILIRSYFNQSNATQTIQLYSTAPLNRTVREEGPYGGWNAVTVYRIIQYADGRSTREAFNSYYIR